MYSKPGTPLSIGGVLDDGFRLLKSSLTKVIWLAVASGLVSQLPALFTPTVEAGEIPEFTTTAIVVSILSIPVSIIIFCALLARLNGVSEGHAMTNAEAIGIGLKRSLSFLVSGILYVLAIFVGFLALVVPGIILMVSLSFCFYLVVTDNMGPIESLKTSHKLVWGNWWRTFVLMSVALFIVIVISLLFGILSGFVQGLLGLGDLITLALIGVLTALTYPIVYALYLAILNDLKLRKQGDDLAARLDQIEQ